jgi:hypothetical protein
VTAVPPEAVGAAARVLHNQVHADLDGGQFVECNRLATLALEAAAPLIAAAERDRICQDILAEAERGAKSGLDRIVMRAYAERLKDAP